MLAANSSQVSVLGLHEHAPYKCSHYSIVIDLVQDFCCLVQSKRIWLLASATHLQNHARGLPQSSAVWLRDQFPASMGTVLVDSPDALALRFGGCQAGAGTVRGALHTGPVLGAQLRTASGASSRGGESVRIGCYGNLMRQPEDHDPKGDSCPSNGCPVCKAE